MNTLLTQRPERLPIVQASHALGLNRSSVYAWRKPTNNDHPERRSRQRAVQPRALSEQERMAVIKIMQSDEHADQPPAQIYQRLLEQQQYLCSVSTMHRLLRSQKQNGERRAQRPLNIMRCRAFWRELLTRCGLGTLPNCRWCAVEFTYPCTWYWICLAASLWPGWSHAKRTVHWPAS